MPGRRVTFMPSTLGPVTPALPSVQDIGRPMKSMSILIGRRQLTRMARLPVGTKSSRCTTDCWLFVLQRRRRHQCPQVNSYVRAKRIRGGDESHSTGDPAHLKRTCRNAWDLRRQQTVKQLPWDLNSILTANADFSIEFLSTNVNVVSSMGTR